MNNQQLQPEEGVDQVTFYREQCVEHAAKFKEMLDECNARVMSRKKTEETCHEEMVDYVHHLDHCVRFLILFSLRWVGGGEGVEKEGRRTERGGEERKRDNFLDQLFS